MKRALFAFGSLLAASACSDSFEVTYEDAPPGQAPPRTTTPAPSTPAPTATYAPPPSAALADDPCLDLWTPARLVPQASSSVLGVRVLSAPEAQDGTQATLLVLQSVGLGSRAVVLSPAVDAGAPTLDPRFPSDATSIHARAPTGAVWYSARRDGRDRLFASGAPLTFDVSAQSTWDERDPYVDRAGRLWFTSVASDRGSVRASSASGGMTESGIDPAFEGDTNPVVGPDLLTLFHARLVPAPPPTEWLPTLHCARRPSTSSPFRGSSTLRGFAVPPGELAVPSDVSPDGCFLYLVGTTPNGISRVWVTRRRSASCGG